MMSKERIAGFDGLRAIAFLLVFVSHKVTTLPHHDSYGVVGVWTFFVLSGFLITRILAGSREKVEIGETTPLAALGAFYLRRSARIFPIYYLILFIFLGLSLFVTIDDFWNLNRLAYFLFGTNFLIGWQNYWVGDFGHLWSLAVEEQFYLLVAPMILFAPRRWTMPICIAMLTISVVTTLVMEAMHVNRTTIDVNPIVNFGMLAYGGVIGLAARPFKSVWITNPAAPLATLAILIVIPWRLGEPEAFMGYGKLSALLSGLLILQIVQGQGSRNGALCRTATKREP